MKLMPLIAVFCMWTAYQGCATQEDVDGWNNEQIEKSVIEPAIHWHQRYVEDNCRRCPECCVAVTEQGFIDSYGVERPLDWLPTPEDDTEASELCEGCPGVDCLCIETVSGGWVLSPEIGDED